MLDDVDLFREKGTVGEFGLGAIRDAFANRLRPGTSTLQTRCKTDSSSPGSTVS
jgi:hypothetical protein